MTMPDGNTAALDRDQNEIDLHAEVIGLYGVVARDELVEHLNGEGFTDLLDFMDDEWADLKIQTKFKAAFDQADALEMGGLVMDAFDRAEKAAVESEWGQMWIKGCALKLYFRENGE